MMRSPQACLAAFALALASGLASPTPLVADDVRSAARRWLAGYDQALAAVVCSEIYAQDVRRKDLQDATDTATRRVVASEFAWVPVLGARDIVGVRAVQRVDDRTVAESGRLETLLRADAPDRAARVQALLAESVRELEVPDAVNFNFPTFALAYLRPGNADRAKWSVRKGPTADTAEVRFRETDRTLVWTREGQRVKGEGSLVVDRATGSVRESRLALNAARAGAGDTPMMESVRYEATVRYIEEPRLGIPVPSEMADRYEWRVRPSGGRGDAAHLLIDGHATYADYRRFQTDARIVP